MTGRVWFVGSNEKTAPQIERGFQEMLALLEAHLATRPYLFGGRPAYGDFGLWGQFYELWTDPTAGALIDPRCERKRRPVSPGLFRLASELPGLL